MLIRISLEEIQERFQASYDMCVEIVRTAAAAELVVWAYEVYPARETQPGPPHRESMVFLYHVHQRKKCLQEGENR